MNLNTIAHRTITRRLFIAGSLMALVLPVFMARLFYLQGVSGSRYRQMADKNRIRVRLIQPPRGRLLDREGREIAIDENLYHLVLIPEQAADVKQTLTRLSRLINLPQERIDKLVEQAKHVRGFTPLTVARTLSFGELSRVQVNLPDLQGLDFISVPVRHYLAAEKMGHLSGYVGIPSADAEKSLPKSWSPDFPIGRRGLELFYDKELTGTAGIREVELNAYGREVREIARQNPTQGQDIKLTLDLEAQQAAWDAMGDYVGSTVVMDINTGGVVVAANKPGLNPNLFADGVSRKDWNSLLNDSQKPLINRALQGIYAPGSTIKPLVALAGLHHKIASETEKITCEGHIRYGRRQFHCWDKHGTLNLHKAIAKSCDIYFYELGRRLGIDTMAQTFRDFGLGQEFELGLPIKDGLVPTKQWKEANKGEKWAGGEDLINAIGQGFMLATPLQLATVAARIATGKKVVPTLEADVLTPNFAALEYSKEHMDFIREGMRAVVEEWYGTARRARVKGIQVAGKTGTSQVISKRYDKDVKMSTRPYKERPHGLFISFAPFDNPRYAVAVVLEHAGSGGGAAAPVAGKVLSHLLG